MKTKNAFCAYCQEVTEHNVEVDGNGEYLLTCTTEDCGRFIKLPADTDKKQFEEVLTEHEKQNKGQVSLEAQEKKLEELLGDEDEE